MVDVEMFVELDICYDEFVDDGLKLIVFGFGGVGEVCWSGNIGVV